MKMGSRGVHAAIVLFSVLLTASAVQAASIDWIRYIQAGNPFQAVFDKTAGRFDDTVYTGNPSTDPLGTLKGGESYTVIYRNGSFSCTGFNQGYGRIGTWEYANADPADNLISLWGRGMVFDGQGRLYDPYHGYVGHLRKGGPADNASDCTLVISGVFDDHYQSTGRYRLAVAINGHQMYAEQRPPFEHGRPYGGIFENWKTLPVRLGGFNSGDSLQVRLTHAGSPGSDWIAIDYFVIACGGKTTKIELADYGNYGVQDGAAAIIYGGQ